MRATSTGDTLSRVVEGRPLPWAALASEDPKSRRHSRTTPLLKISSFHYSERIIPNKGEKADCSTPKIIYATKKRRHGTFCSCSTSRWSFIRETWRDWLDRQRVRSEKSRWCSIDRYQWTLIHSLTLDGLKINFYERIFPFPLLFVLHNRKKGRKINFETPKNVESQKNLSDWWKLGAKDLLRGEVMNANHGTFKRQKKKLRCEVSRRFGWCHYTLPFASIFDTTGRDWVEIQVTSNVCGTFIGLMDFQ